MVICLLADRAVFPHWCQPHLPEHRHPTRIRIEVALAFLLVSSVPTAMIALRVDPVPLKLDSATLIVKLSSKVPNVRTKRGLDHVKCWNCQNYLLRIEQTMIRIGLKEVQRHRQQCKAHLGYNS